MAQLYKREGPTYLEALGPTATHDAFSRNCNRSHSRPQKANRIIYYTIKTDRD